MAPVAKAKPDKEEKQRPDRSEQVARLMGLLHRDHTQPQDPPPPDDGVDDDQDPIPATKPAAAGRGSANSGRRAGCAERGEGSSASARRAVAAPPSPSHGMAPSVSWEGPQCNSRGSTLESPRYANAPPPQQQQPRGRPRPPAVQAPSPRGVQAVVRPFSDSSPRTPPDQPPPRDITPVAVPQPAAGRALPRPKSGGNLQGPPLPSPRGAISLNTWSNSDGAAPAAGTPRKNRAPSVRFEGGAGDDGEGRPAPMAAPATASPNTGAARAGAPSSRREAHRASSMGDFPDAGSVLVPPLSPPGTSAAGGVPSTAVARGRRAATKHASLGSHEYEGMGAVGAGLGNPALSPLNAAAASRAGGARQAAQGGVRAGFSAGASPPSAGMVRAANGAAAGARRAAKHMSLGRDDYQRMEAAASGGYMPAPSPPHGRIAAAVGNASGAPPGADGAAAAARAARPRAGRRASMGDEGMEALMRTAGVISGGVPAGAASGAGRKSVDDMTLSQCGAGGIRGNGAGRIDGERRRAAGREGTREEQRSEKAEGRSQSEEAEGRKQSEEDGREEGATGEVGAEDQCGSPVLGVQRRAQTEMGEGEGEEEEEEEAEAEAEAAEEVEEEEDEEDEEEEAESAEVRSGEKAASGGGGRKSSLARSLTEDEEGAGEQPRGRGKGSPKTSGKRLERRMEADDGEGGRRGAGNGAGEAANLVGRGRGRAAARARGAGKGRVVQRSMEADEWGEVSDPPWGSGEREVGGEEARGAGAGGGKKGGSPGSGRKGSLARSLTEDEEGAGEEETVGQPRGKAQASPKGAGGRRVARRMEEDESEDGRRGGGNGAKEGHGKAGGETRGAGKGRVRPRSMEEGEWEEASRTCEKRVGGEEEAKGVGATSGKKGCSPGSGRKGSLARSLTEDEEDTARMAGKAAGSPVPCPSDEEEAAHMAAAHMAAEGIKGGEREQHATAEGARQKAKSATPGKKCGLVRSMTEDEDEETAVVQGHGARGGEAGRQGAGRRVQAREHTNGQLCGEGQSVNGQARGEGERRGGVMQGEADSEAAEGRGDLVQVGGRAGGSLARGLSDDEEEAQAAEGSTIEQVVKVEESEQRTAEEGVRQQVKAANPRKKGLLVRSLTEDEDEEEGEVPVKPVHLESGAKPRGGGPQGARGARGGGRAAGATRRAPREGAQRAGGGLLAGQQVEVAQSEELAEAKGSQKEKGKRGIGGLMSRLKVLAV